MKPSMPCDPEAGKPLELDWLTVAVCRLGRTDGPATPATDRVHDELGPYTDGAQRASA